MNTAFSGASSIPAAAKPLTARSVSNEIDLPAECVAAHCDVDGAERHLVGTAVQDGGRQRDHAGAGSVRGHAALQPVHQRITQFEHVQQPTDRGRLAAGYDDALHLGELGRPAHRDGAHPDARQRGDMLAHVALQRQHAKGQRGRHCVTDVTAATITSRARRAGAAPGCRPR
jgi:hypothetical protein